MDELKVWLIATVTLGSLSAIVIIYIFAIKRASKSNGKLAAELLNITRNGLMANMPELPVYHLKRRYFGFGTFSDWYDVQGNLICNTVEQPWNNNEVGASCVKEGVYVISPFDSPSHGDVYILSAPQLGVTKTPEEGGTRSLCEIHVANTPSELKGCIAPGESFGVVNNQWAVVSSQKAFDKLKELLDNKPAILVIGKA
ncbi:DUF5675 family protein [Vibrio algivorus]|uniref:DUF5675 family protein n=1 Tax=Vibrio algivorus TaxID=1667024 RepID=UPI001FD38A98|nr:DUF5675 family protein [Vibrio algivorus]